MTSVLAIGSGGSYVDLPTPSYSGYMTTPNEVSKAGTNTSGILYKDRIRVRQSIEVHWNAATAEEKNLILSLTNRNSFNVRYFDTEDDQFKYGLFYRGNDLRIEPLLQYTGTGFKRYAVSFTMVEF